MSGDELSRKNQRLRDGIALVGDAHEAGRLEALEEVYERACRPEATIDSLVTDLADQIAALRERREDR